jgi:hypothetical protein
VDELLMALMGFSIDPGPLPFCTVRDAKWGARLESIGWVGIHGEHGCEMPYQVAKVMSIGAITYANAKHWWPMPAIYADGRPLVQICLEAMPEEERAARGIPKEKP